MKGRSWLLLATLMLVTACEGPLTSQSAPSTATAATVATPSVAATNTPLPALPATVAPSAKPLATATQSPAQGLPPGWRLYANANSVHDVAINARQLFAATSDGVLVWDLASGTLVKHWTFRDGLSNNHTTAIAYCPIGAPALVIGTQRGLDLYDPQSDQWQHLTRESGALHGTTVQSLACDVKNGRGLIGYESDGLDIFDAKTGRIRHLGSADGLISDQVTALAYVAATNETWVGSPYGVSVITDKGITNYDKDKGKMPDQDIRAIAADAAGSVWLGAYSGMIKYTKGVWKLYSDQTIRTLSVPSTASRSRRMARCGWRVRAASCAILIQPVKSVWWVHVPRTM